MSVEYVKLSEASKAMRYVGSSKVQSNFHDIFGTDNCLLQCLRRKELQILRSTKRSATCIEGGIKLKPLNDHFTMRQLEGSVANGCGSCKMWSCILKILFGDSRVVTAEKHSISCTYSVSPGFVLEQVIEQENSTKERRIQLFCPEASRVQLQSMPIARFLIGKRESVERLSQWLQECEANHFTCAPASNTTLPARLLDVRAADDKGTLGLRLLETKTGQSYRYICLSHRWGPATMKTRNTVKTLDKLKEFIVFNQLPANFRRAVALTQELGVQFLWIDSMCIIQEGDDGRDWNLESAKMADIYRGAYLTIAMAWNDNEDLFSIPDSNTSDNCLRLTDEGGHSYFIGTRDYDQRVGGSWKHIKELQSKYPLFTRGWIYQERLLSPRILTCHREEFTFHCLEHFTCECGSVTIAPHPHHPFQSIFSDNLTHRRHLAGQIHRPGGNVARFQKRWHEIVITYMSLNLTEQRDILPGIAGCARALWALEGYEYVAGLWRRTISRDLMWYNAGRQGRITPRPKCWTAPTWSWASIKAGQTIQFFVREGQHSIYDEFLSETTIKEIWCEKSTEDPFGRLKSAHLKLDAQLFPCEMRHFCVSIAARKYRRLDDLHHPRQNNRNRAHCPADSPGLNTYGASVSTYLDISLRTELNYVPMKTCTKGCGLAKVHLLRMVQQRRQTQVGNYFMILKRIEEQNSTYQRIGVVTLTGHDASQSAKWFEEVWIPSVSSIETITIT